MLTQAQKKIIKLLHKKSGRIEYSLFIAEGEKIVSELLLYAPELIQDIYATQQWNCTETLPNHVSCTGITEKELSQLSSLATPNKVLAVARIPERKLDVKNFTEGVSLYLSHINDPGNLGTILRTADWFGINSIVCSEQTVDAYNPKVIQAAMGALFRVQVFYTDEESFLKSCQQQKIPLLGADASGTSIYNFSFPQSFVLLMGSESHGLSDICKSYLQTMLAIPGLGKTESLNVAVATAILCAEIRRPL